MEEDLEMYGNQLVTSTTVFTVGYVIGQVPFNLLLTRVSPRWVIPSVSLLKVTLAIDGVPDVNIIMLHSSRWAGV